MKETSRPSSPIENITGKRVKNVWGGAEQEQKFQQELLSKTPHYRELLKSPSIEQQNQIFSKIANDLGNYIKSGEIEIEQQTVHLQRFIEKLCDLPGSTDNYWQKELPQDLKNIVNKELKYYQDTEKKIGTKDIGIEFETIGLAMLYKVSSIDDFSKASLADQLQTVQEFPKILKALRTLFKGDLIRINKQVSQMLQQDSQDSQDSQDLQDLQNLRKLREKRESTRE